MLCYSEFSSLYVACSNCLPLITFEDYRILVSLAWDVIEFHDVPWCGSFYIQSTGQWMDPFNIYIQASSYFTLSSKQYNW